MAKNSNKYEMKCAEYIYDSEFEDFYDWLQDDAVNVLDEETRKVLIDYHDESDKGLTKRVKEAFQEAEKFHIYASAWLCVIG